MKAILLARVSTEEQKEAGNSLPSQIARLQRYCDEKGLTITKTYNFDESAWKSDRVEFKKIIDSLQRSKDVMALCCDKIDRLIRNFSKDLVLLEELRKKGRIELHFPSDNIILHKESPATDLFRFTMGVSLAKYYSDSISDNVKRANENKIRKGEWIGKAPIGYLNVVDSIGNKDIVPDTDKSQHVKKMFENYATGSYSVDKLQEFLTEHGFLTKCKKPIAKSHIYKMLKNPFYYGEMLVKENTYPHRYFPIISKEVFDEVQRIRLGWKKQKFQYQSIPFIFRGLIKCADCGCTISPENKKGHTYYSCTNAYKFHDKRTYIKESELLAQIYSLFEGIKLPEDRLNILIDDLRKTHQSEKAFYNRTIINLRKDYDRIELMIDELLELRAKKQITEEFYLRKIESFSQKQKDIIKLLDYHDTADTNHYMIISKILTLTQKARELFDNSDTVEKRKLINFIFQNCELKGKKLQYKLKSPFDILLKVGSCSIGWGLENVFRTFDWVETAKIAKILYSEFPNLKSYDILDYLQNSKKIADKKVS